MVACPLVRSIDPAKAGFAIIQSKRRALCPVPRSQCGPVGISVFTVSDQLLYKWDDIGCVVSVDGKSQDDLVVKAEKVGEPVDGFAQNGHAASFQQNGVCRWDGGRSEEHTSELQSLMRISYAVFC